MQLKKCPMCNSTKIRRIREDLEAVVKGKKIVVPDVDRIKCFSCSEEFFDHASNEKIDAYRGNRKAAA